MPVASGSYDVVLNVESSHCYPNFDRFLNEAIRVLRSNGYLVFADLRGRNDIPRLREQLLGHFELVEEESVRHAVIQAGELDNERRLALIRRRAPKFLYSALEAFGCVKGSPIFEAFKSGELEYVRFVLRKKSEPMPLLTD